jgi:hypothetical protein
MLKIRKIKESEKYNLPKIIPPLFWINSDSGTNYFMCYRSLTKFIDYTNKYMCVAQYNKKLIGTECWICLDLTNGWIDNYDQPFFCWIFNSKEEAEKRYQKHKNNKKLATLKKPVKCIVIEKVNIKVFYEDIKNFYQDFYEDSSID